VKDESDWERARAERESNNNNKKTMSISPKRHFKAEARLDVHTPEAQSSRIHSVGRKALFSSALSYTYIA
jgi:hypothetical protein